MNRHGVAASGGWLRDLAGDLDTIVFKAIRKEPDERYASVAAFSDDLQRFLEDRPIRARDVGNAERAVKFVRRHRTAASLLAVLAGMAAAGVISTIRQAKRAERRFQQVRSLANAFVFDVHDSIADLPGATEARQRIVSTALTYLESLRNDAGDDPELALELASAYERVGSVQGLPLENNLCRAYWRCRARRASRGIAVSSRRERGDLSCGEPAGAAGGEARRGAGRHCPRPRLALSSCSADRQVDS